MKRVLYGLILLGLTVYRAGAQAPVLSKGRFFSFTHLALNFCQIDGDHASGYNKTGYSAGYMVGQSLGSGLVYETGIGYSIRGSRRPFNPDDPGSASFNLEYSMLDIPVYLMKYQGNYAFGGGLITTLTLSAKDKDQYILHLDTDTKKVNMLGCAQLGYFFNKNIRALLQYQYSLNSLRISNNSNNPFFRTGVYHNVISLGINYLLQSN